MTGDYQASPQMVEGYQVEADGKRWTLTLREGLKFHDGEPVLAGDCAASIRRWGQRNPFGQALLAATDDVSAADDRKNRVPIEQAVSQAARRAWHDHPVPRAPTSFECAASSGVSGRVSVL